ncbi:hypothetical protein GCM10025862_18300 [Arsenicicoccus piscis]|uniref:Uncharacterized protein n=1 Tax=Arsenicicoccus piscis TaxID=673954 RepID=A0ABQ6HMY8_9MICO|nr:hypothetical protein GCM10025862_18300 [Arsenicicoccus piscis]
MQAGGEVQLATHGALGHGGHLGLATRVVRQQLDDLVLDQRGVDVHHHQAAPVPGQPGGGDGHVEALARRGRGQPAAQHRRADPGHLVLDGGDRSTRHPAHPVGVRTKGREEVRHGGQVRGEQRSAEHGDHRPLERPGRLVARPAAQREVEVEVYGTGGERRLHPVGRLRREAAEQHRQRDVATHDHLLDVQHLGALGAQPAATNDVTGTDRLAHRREQRGGQPGAVGAGDEDQQGGLRGGGDHALTVANGTTCRRRHPCRRR